MMSSARPLAAGPGDPLPVHGAEYKGFAVLAAAHGEAVARKMTGATSAPGWDEARAQRTLKAHREQLAHDIDQGDLF